MEGDPVSVEVEESSLNTERKECVSNANNNAVEESEESKILILSSGKDVSELETESDEVENVSSVEEIVQVKESNIPVDNKVVPSDGTWNQSQECESISITSSDSATIDTESADENYEPVFSGLQMKTSHQKVEAPPNLPQLSSSQSLPDVKSLLVSEHRKGSESSSSSNTLHSSQMDGTRTDFHVPTDSSEEDYLLSELECELVNGGSQQHGINKNHSSPWKESSVNLEYYKYQIDLQQQTITQLHQELSAVKALQVDEDLKNKELICQIKTEYVGKLDRLSKQFEAAKRDKESMVMKYAQSEREVIMVRKAKDELEKKYMDVARDRESMSGKLRVLHADRVRACSNLDNKLSELVHTQRELEKTREEVNIRDIKIKWNQSKLKAEMDAHKETQTKLEQTFFRLNQMREETEQVRKDCHEMVRRYQEADERKNASLDIQQRQKLSDSLIENNALTVKIQTLERERLDHEQTVSRLKESQNGLRQEVVDLNSRLSEMENLRQQLERERERVVASQKEAERIRMTNLELQSDMDSCHLKEGELLEFTERLTTKSMQLQSEHSLLEVKAQNLDEERTSLLARNGELEKSCQCLQESLEKEQAMRLEETQLLARKLAEKTKLAENLNQKLEEAANENRVMKRRHLASVKELSRELTLAKKRLDIFESSGGIENGNLSKSSSFGASDQNGLGLTGSSSLRSSTCSLDKIGRQANLPLTNGSTMLTNGDQNYSRCSASPNQLSSNSLANSTTPSSSKGEPAINIDSQVLIERIVRLQKNLARKNEKIEFFEEHIQQLLSEIKKKNRIIQNYILREESGALVPMSMDQNKAEMAHHKGTIMASVYKNQITSDDLTIELSMEINQKLQAVLEDTLLKNMTLLENINTLGEEIARITKEHRDLQNIFRQNSRLTS